MTESSIHTLTGLLRGANVEPVLVPERIAPSAIYDLQYRITVNACVFLALAESYQGSGTRIRAAKQKLVQFVAIRPWLLPVVRQWSTAQKNPQLATRMSQRLRRGYLGDVMHDSVVEFLVAAGVLEYAGPFLSLGVNGHRLTQWSESAISANLFANERTSIEEFKTVKITNDMLEGW
jgi:hypothetical protein